MTRSKRETIVQDEGRNSDEQELVAEEEKKRRRSYEGERNK